MQERLGRGIWNVPLLLAGAGEAHAGERVLLASLEVSHPHCPGEEKLGGQGALRRPGGHFQEEGEPERMERRGQRQLRRGLAAGVRGLAPGCRREKRGVGGRGGGLCARQRPSLSR